MTRPSCLMLALFLGLILAGRGNCPAQAAAPAAAKPLAPNMVHLRCGEPREWSSFPAKAAADHLEIHFQAKANARAGTLKLRQEDVKQRWRVVINKQPIGDLARDESDQTIYLPVPSGALLDGENVLRIEAPASTLPTADDIRVGEIVLDERAVEQALGEAALAVEVVDGANGAALPARITIVQDSGSLQQFNADVSDRVAVRPGVVYTLDGTAEVRLPAGKYTVYAGRGFEYSVAESRVVLREGKRVSQTLEIRREVPTAGYVAADTHIHTLTYSGHGDATIAERMVTLAGEGIELPIATDHNTHVDYRSYAAKVGADRFFTPVIGNEVTTPIGHFNIFPVEASAPPPKFRHETWEGVFGEIFATPGVKVAILNHARDVHSRFRPFDPRNFNAATGSQVEAWPMRFNGMEVINSGATQSNLWQLFDDWMAVLNRGYAVSPVGSSDSHEVSRHIVGQGRTYIRLADEDVSRLEVQAAVENFLEGKVLISYGLLVEAIIAGKYRSGETAVLAGDQVALELRVLGPHWTKATRVQVFANGQPIWQRQLDQPGSESLPGVKWQDTIMLPRPRHDVHLVAIATGPGIDAPYWPTAKPYQPASPDWEPYVLGASGAIWLDADGDGRRSSPRDYADRLVASHAADIPALLAALAEYDAAVASQVAELLNQLQPPADQVALSRAVDAASEHVRRGFAAYRRATLQTERARAMNP